MNGAPSQGQTLWLPLALLSTPAVAPDAPRRRKVSLTVTEAALALTVTAFQPAAPDSPACAGKGECTSLESLPILWHWQ